MLLTKNFLKNLICANLQFSDELLSASLRATRTLEHSVDQSGPYSPSTPKNQIFFLNFYVLPDTGYTYYPLMIKSPDPLFHPPLLLDFFAFIPP